MIASMTHLFGLHDLASMRREDMQQLIVLLCEFKNNLFAETIYKLELDPSLADVPACSSLTEIDSGHCRKMDDQREEHKSNVAKDALNTGDRISEPQTIENLLCTLALINTRIFLR